MISLSLPTVQLYTSTQPRHAPDPTRRTPRAEADDPTRSKASSADGLVADGVAVEALALLARCEVGLDPLASGHGRVPLCEPGEAVERLGREDEDVAQAAIGAGWG